MFGLTNCSQSGFKILHTHTHIHTEQVSGLPQMSASPILVQSGGGGAAALQGGPSSSDQEGTE